MNTTINLPPHLQLNFIIGCCLFYSPEFDLVPGPFVKEVEQHFCKYFYGANRQGKCKLTGDKIGNKNRVKGSYGSP